MTTQDKAQAFLEKASLYHLGALVTEQAHPLTHDLSRLAQEDLVEAYSVLRKVDVQALEQFETALPQLKQLERSIQSTLDKGGRIFICGCGATGRLALNLEYLWNRSNPGSTSVISFMAGGDVALVHALEGFEDFPEYGARHLKELGFCDGDLLISSTEGGETPFVIGATEEAVRISSKKPFFLYCNPSEILIEKVERSKRVLQNPGIESICLFVGPMAIAGSTRMQASTVLMLGIGLALLKPGQDWAQVLDQLKSHLQNLDLNPWASLTEAEAKIYQSGDHSLYQADEFAMTVMTDTTERAPTFSFSAFDNQKFPKPKASLTYLFMPHCRGVDQAWNALLGRRPRPLEWPEIHLKASKEYLQGFDFGVGAHEFRKNLLPQKNHHVIEVLSDSDRVEVRLESLKTEFKRADQGLMDHLLLKMMLNAHSTLVMGRLGRYQGNLMTYVVPTNGKLIDRATRYVQILLEREGHKDKFSYAEILKVLFTEFENLKEDEPIVLKTLAALLKNP